MSTEEKGHIVVEDHTEELQRLQKRATSLRTSFTKGGFRGAERARIGQSLHQVETRIVALGGTPDTKTNPVRGIGDGLLPPDRE